MIEDFVGRGLPRLLFFVAASRILAVTSEILRFAQDDNVVGQDAESG